MGFLSSALGFVGGLIGNSSAKKAQKNQQNLSIWQQGEANALSREQMQLARDMAFQSQQNSDHWNQVGLDHARHLQAEAVRQFNSLQGERSREIQTRVKDAVAAGLHPLYALGAASSGGGGTVTGTHFQGGSPQLPGMPGLPGMAPIEGQSATGSMIGAGIQAVAGFLDRKEAKEEARRREKRVSRRDEAATRLAEARVRTEELEQARLASLVKTAEQKSNQVRTFPLPGEEKLQWMRLPTKANPPEAHSETVTMYDQRTGETYKVPNPDVYEEPWSPATLGAGYYYLKKYGRYLGNTVQYYAGARKSRPKWRKRHAQTR